MPSPKKLESPDFSEDEAESFLHLVEHPGVAIAALMHRRNADDGESDDHRDERDAIHQKTEGRAPQGEDQSAQRGTDHPRQIELHRVHGDGVRHVLPPNEQGQQRDVSRTAERLRAAGEKRQHEDVPHLHGVCVDQRRQHERERHLQILREQHDLAPLQAVGNHAAEEREEQHRPGGQKSIDAEEQRGIRHGVDEPALGQRLHECARGGREGAEPQQTEIAIVKCAEGAMKDARRGRRRFRFERRFFRKRSAHRAIFSLAALAPVCAWQMATAKASDASTDITRLAHPGRSIRTILATCCFSAAP